LRHPKAISSVSDFSYGKFLPLIESNNIENSKIERLVFCSGKFYYDLNEYMEKNKIQNTSLVRLEQLFPLPIVEINDVLEKYTNATDIVWAQEEPRNMGAWAHLLLHSDNFRDFRVASRRFYSSPSAGSSTRSNRRHNEVVEYVFDSSKNNLN
jgi:2-oxoglutarate dehydrogenase E1 component